MTHDPDFRQGSPSLLVGCGMLAATFLAHVCGGLLVGFAVLRENPVFWTHAGGYPIGLRDLVLWSYIPLWVGTVVLLGGLSMACVAHLGSGLRFFMLESLLLLVGWGLVTTSGLIALQNNLGNFLNGLPIHSHK